MATKAITKAKPRKLNKVNELPIDAIIRLAVNKDIDTQKLKELIDLKNREEARRAKQEFDFHFAEMQKAFIPVQKNKKVHNINGDLLYSYCPLENILKAYQPVITKHGFSYRWSEESIKDGKEIRVWCIISGYGHEEKVYTDIPIMPASKVTNIIQQRGVAKTYGKRYSFNDGFGIIIEGEDTDAVSDRIESTDTVLKITMAENGKSKPAGSLPDICTHLINKLKTPALRIQFAKYLNAIRKKYKDDKAEETKKLAILKKYLEEEKRHLSASLFNELNKELGSSVTG